MSKFRSLDQLVAAVTANVGVSKYKTARAHKFIFKHRKAHKHIIPKLIKQQQEHEREKHNDFNRKRKEWSKE